jgi:hypothetical protein
MRDGVIFCSGYSLGTHSYTFVLQNTRRVKIIFFLQFTPNEEFLQILMKCIQEISHLLRVALAPPNNPHIAMMRSLLETTMQLRITQNHNSVLALLQKASPTLNLDSQQ